MSKLCGVCHLDSRPVSYEDAARVRAGLNTPTYVGAQEYREPGVLMGCAVASHSAPTRDLYQPADRSCCSWDGRLDNRKELLLQTGLPADCADSTIALGLYQHKGVDGLRDLMGDWSLCIWDANRRTVVLASDYAGIRPLYYHWSAGKLYWSSCLADVAGWTGITELDQVYVGSFLLRGSASARTPFAGIFAVPPGHAVRISKDGMPIRAFWSLPVHQEIRYRDERCYEEQLLDLFREAVEVRIRNEATVCAELSGGLDSSSIVCMADRLRKQASGRGPDLQTFSYTHENCPDERYFREVERVCDLSGCHLELQSYPAAAADQASSNPAWWEPRLRELARRMAAIGSAVFLTGQLGDLIMGNTTADTEQVTEWLVAGKFWKAGQEAYGWARSLGVPIYPVLWRSIREACSSWVPPVSPRDAVAAIRASTEDSLCEALHRGLAWDERQRLADAAWRHAPPGRRRRFRAVHEVLESRSLQAPEALQHVCYTHPFAHRPLVEFMLTIPARVVCGPGQPRRLMRRAFAALLPPLVLNRKSKAAYTSIYRGALIPLAGVLLKRPAQIEVVKRGYVEGKSLTSRLERFTHGLDCNESQLRQIILFEFWLRNRAVREETTTASESAVL